MNISRAHKRNAGRNFIRVLLHSGTRANPLGDEEVTIFCQCNNEEPSADDVNIARLVKWVNNNPGCRKNQSRNLFRVSKEADAKTVVFLTVQEIRSCHNADRIFPRIKPAVTTKE